MTSKLFTTITGFGSTSDSPYLPDPTGEILDRLNSYSGDNIWVDVIRTYDVDEDATERLDPSGASDVFCLDDGREFRFDHQLGSWVEAGF